MVNSNKNRWSLLQKITSPEIQYMIVYRLNKLHDFNESRSMRYISGLSRVLNGYNKQNNPLNHLYNNLKRQFLKYSERTDASSPREPTTFNSDDEITDSSYPPPLPSIQKSNSAMKSLFSRQLPHQTEFNKISEICNKIRSENTYNVIVNTNYTTSVNLTAYALFDFTQKLDEFVKSELLNTEYKGGFNV
jgi:hypothetical protein